MRRRAALVASLLVLALVAVPAAASPVAETQADERFPVEYDTEGIRLGEERAVTIPGVGGRFIARWYVDDTYRCGRIGNFAHLVIEREDLVGRTAPLWVLMHGGGVGYYDETGTYQGGESRNDEESIDDLLDQLRRRTEATPGQPEDTVVSRRLAEGWRVMFTSLCDHDLYSGFGNIYPNNPNWGDDPDTVDGLPATMAAVDVTVNGNGRLDGHPTSRLFLHGGSAGSAGAYSLSYAFWRSGIDLTGAVLDSSVISERTEDLANAGVINQTPEDLPAIQAKIGPFVTDPSLFVEQTVAAGFDAVPLFDVTFANDPLCGGTAPPIPTAVAAGFDNNCRYVHGLLADAVAGQPGTLHRTSVVEGEGHVVTNQAGPVHDQIDDWVAAVLATDPPDPWPRADDPDGPGYPAVRGIGDACPEGIPRPGYSDVEPSNVHRRAIGCLRVREVVLGYPDGTYRPAAVVTRDQVASFLARLISDAGGVLPADPPDAFTDDDGSAHEEAINRLTALGIVEGATPTTFRPRQPVTRAQLMSLVARTAEELTGRPLDPSGAVFRDVAGVHAEAIFASARAGLTGGTRQGLFAPSLPTPRDQTASLLTRLLDLLNETDEGG